MPRVVRLAAAAVVVALAPRIAHAEGPPLSSVEVFCQPGSLNNCFAFALHSEDGHLTYYLQNLQGSVQPGGSSFRIRSIILENRLVDGPSPPFDSNQELRYFEATPTGELPPAGTPLRESIFSIEGNVLRGEQFLSIDSNALPFFQRAYLAFSGGIYGCNTVFATFQDLVELSTAQTCLPTGLDGWLRFDALSMLVNNLGAPIRPATFDDLTIRIEGCVVHVGALSGGPPPFGSDCSTDISYEALLASFTTVPEPATLLLVGSGLAGTGLFARRRRRDGGRSE
jgi:hypothetical protein